MDIRKGKFFNESTGEFNDEFFELLNEYETRLNYASNNTSLPEKPDKKKIEDLMIDINEKSIKTCEG
jgi:hypothetical protein